MIGSYLHQRWQYQENHIDLLLLEILMVSFVHLESMSYLFFGKMDVQNHVYKKSKSSLFFDVVFTTSYFSKKSNAHKCLNLTGRHI